MMVSEQETLPSLTQQEKARQLRQQGKTLVSIAAELGVHRETVRRWLDPEVYNRHKTSNKNYAKANQEKVQRWKQKYQNNSETKAKGKLYRQANKERLAARQKRYYENNKDRLKKKSKDYYCTNRAQILKKEAQKYPQKAAKKALYYRRWQHDNQHIRAAARAERRARKLRATPSWLTLEHRRAFQQLEQEKIALREQTNQVHHIDHIYPLVGKAMLDGKYQQVACGLHVPWNLRVILGSENCKKNCKMPDPTVDPPTAW